MTAAPKRWLLAALYRITRSQMVWLRWLLIRGFMFFYAIDLSDAATGDLRAYSDFNAFFTRALGTGRRPPGPAPDLLSPVDGTLVSFGQAHDSDVVSVKSQAFSWTGLGSRASPTPGLFDPDAVFFNFYLAPHDYHRVHMPSAGRLVHAEWIPGRFRSVNPSRVARRPDTLAQNERVLLTFATECGPLQLILIAARLVGGIETPWCPARLSWQDTGPAFQEALARGIGRSFGRGDEIGRFNYGSSVIVLAPGSIWQPTRDLGKVRVGETCARPRA